MGGAFPELIEQQEHVMRVLADEERQFLVTLDRGIEQFEKVTAATLKSGKKVLQGSDIFKLYDTYGFPVDLTELMAEEKDMVVDVAQYEAEMEKARQQSRDRQRAGGEVSVLT